MSAIGVLATQEEHTTTIVRSLRAGAMGVPVHVGEDIQRLIDQAQGEPRALFVDPENLTAALLAIGRARCKVFVMWDQPDPRALKQAAANPRVTGFIGCAGGVRSWEVTYLARRLTAPQEAPPDMGQLLSWGATTVVWKPGSTEEQRKIVDRIEGMCGRLGVDRRASAAVSTATHELLMNAMYDAPTDVSGRPKYALDRRASIQLDESERPTLRFTISGDFIALDCIDPHGRIPRNRYFEGVLRGVRNRISGDAQMDTSHGGAGLGLYTLYASGCTLRAELVPLKLTHMSWVFDRRVARKDQRSVSRSLYFLPITGR